MEEAGGSNPPEPTRLLRRTNVRSDASVRAIEARRFLSRYPERRPLDRLYVEQICDWLDIQLWILRTDEQFED